MRVGASESLCLDVCPTYAGESVYTSIYPSLCAVSLYTHLDVQQHGLGGGRVPQVLEDGDEVVEVVPVHWADVVEALLIV